MIDKGVCDKGFIWNPNNCECEYGKSCNISEYLDYSKCKCKRRLLDPLIEECTENINEVKINNENKNKSKSKYSFSIVYIVCIVLFSIILVISFVIIIYFVCQKYVNGNKYELPY